MKNRIISFKTGWIKCRSMHKWELLAERVDNFAEEERLKSINHTNVGVQWKTEKISSKKSGHKFTQYLWLMLIAWCVNIGMK